MAGEIVGVGLEVEAPGAFVYEFKILAVAARRRPP